MSAASSTAWDTLRAAVEDGREAARSKDQERMLAADRLFYRGLWEASENRLFANDVLVQRFHETTPIRRTR